MKALKSKISKKVKKFLKDDDGQTMGETERIEPPSRPQSSLASGPSESTPPNLEKRKSDIGPAPRSDTPSVSAHHLSASGIDKNDPARVSSPAVGTAPTLPAATGTAPETPSIPDPRISIHDVDETKPPKLSGYGVDPTAAYENNPTRKSTLYAGTKVALDIVKEASDVFVPLKSVAGGLSAVLKYYDQTMANRKTIESLVPRVEGLAKSLKDPAPEGEVKEMERRETLLWKLQKAVDDLKVLEEQGKVAGFLNNTKDAEALTGLAEDVRDAMIDYQTALQQDIYFKNHQLIDATDRLLLNGMYHTADAGYRSGNREGCLRGTRRDVLLQIEQWLMDENDQRIFWLNGLAGTGKTTIAQTFAETTFADGKLGASFFCSREFENRRNLQAIFPTLAFQLAYQYPMFREQLLKVLRANPDVGQESLCSQLEKVIIRPLQATNIPTLIIIDALDECKDKEPASAILSLLSRYIHKIPEVKFFITGRPEPPIRKGFRLELLHPITEVLKLHEVKPASIDEDIKLYLRTHLTHTKHL